MELLRRFVTAAPAFRTFHDDKPTLLVSWWCTFYSITVILFRVCGRYIRAEKIFHSDGLMLASIVPLMIRMALVHVILLYGTNNTVTESLTALEIRRRETGSQLVLVSRIMYTAYLWMIKYSVSMYLDNITPTGSQHRYQKLLRYLHIFLAVSFVGAVISDLAACQPFSHYWQVVPDPGPQCRQGYAHLLTSGVLNILTNIVLVVRDSLRAGSSLPPLDLHITNKRHRKTSIIIRMALPLAGVALTCYQLPMVVNHRGEQHFRSLVASFDILLVTFASNAVVLGSFLQDRGYKKTKYKHGDARSGFNVRKGSASGVAGREFGATKIMHDRWGSDEDLMRTSDKGSVVIGLEELPSPVETKKPNMPAKVRFPEIRVASTWDIQVDKRDDKP
ncbi:hypothetical protein D0Z07_8879 [Hyphodiscus hymeniophilus]|uniref:Rhodopsin domain-containing protein n=1 Tax=Hyphodiscus hymeniophilus TaxID=353542 RepID=A0A9P6SMS6_9HELO|nr:hypothetical protein D0Z07_8879 [Hyphodiscus hymeniophilus]